MWHPCVCLCGRGDGRVCVSIWSVCKFVCVFLHACAHRVLLSEKCVIKQCVFVFVRVDEWCFVSKERVLTTWLEAAAEYISSVVSLFRVRRSIEVSSTVAHITSKSRLWSEDITRPNLPRTTWIGVFLHTSMVEGSIFWKTCLLAFFAEKKAKTDATLHVCLLNMKLREKVETGKRQDELTKSAHQH